MFCEEASLSAAHHEGRRLLYCGAETDLKDANDSEDTERLQVQHNGKIIAPVEQVPQEILIR